MDATPKHAKAPGALFLSLLVSLLLSAACRRSASVSFDGGSVECRRVHDALHTVGVPAMDALLALPTSASASADASSVDAPDGAARAVFAVAPSVLRSSAYLQRLRVVLLPALEARVDSVPFRSRVVLQNDLFGLWQRMRPRDNETEATELLAVRRLVARLVLRVAPQEQELTDDARTAMESLPQSLLLRLPLREGWREMGTEHTLLSHEGHFGRRRLFRIFEQGTPVRAMALASQLVALGNDGRVRMTSVVGEIEVRAKAASGGGGSLEVPRVWELDRSALRCGVDDGLQEPALIGNIPGLGANGFLAERTPPEPLSTRLCAGVCHRAGLENPMSLPRNDPQPTRRWNARLVELQRDAQVLVEEARTQ